MIVYTVYRSDKEFPVHFLLDDDLQARLFAGHPTTASDAFRMLYPGARYLTQSLFEDVIYTKQLHENKRREWLRLQGGAI